MRICSYTESVFRVYGFEPPLLFEFQLRTRFNTRRSFLKDVLRCSIWTQFWGSIGALLWLNCVLSLRYLCVSTSVWPIRHPGYRFLSRLVTCFSYRRATNCLGFVNEGLYDSRKPTKRGLYLNFNSNHSSSTKKGNIQTFIHPRPFAALRTPKKGESKTLTRYYFTCKIFLTKKYWTPVPPQNWVWFSFFLSTWRQMYIQNNQNRYEPILFQTM